MVVRIWETLDGTSFGKIIIMRKKLQCITIIPSLVNKSCINAMIKRNDKSATLKEIFR